MAKPPPPSGPSGPNDPCIRKTTDAALFAADQLDAAHAEIVRLRAEVASLRLTLGGRTFGPEPVEPIGCPAPGACVQVAEIGRLRSIIRVNGLRAGATHAEIDEVLYAKR